LTFYYNSSIFAKHVPKIDFGNVIYDKIKIKLKQFDYENK